MRLSRCTAAWALPLLIVAGCGSSVYYVKPPDWIEKARRDSAIARFAPACAGRTIFLDPGHGGDDRKSIGPAGDVVEADANLRVALKLREYLAAAGAQVIMSREKDASVPLEARARMANANRADLFVSIHHNSAENPYTNYTSTWYHALSGTPDYQPSSQDLARYIQRDLSFVMGNPGPLASFDGTLSDYTRYPDKGFAVLRDAQMPAVLVECGFFSSAYEEKRLRLAEFNDIEAWGIFRGIGKYLQAGAPRIECLSPLAFAVSRPLLELIARDSSGIDDESIRVFIDDREQGFSFNAGTGVIKVTAGEELAPGYHQCTARMRNKNHNHSFPFKVDFSVGMPPATIAISVDPEELPPDPRAFCTVTASARDSAGNLLAADLPLHFRATGGRDTVLNARSGTARLTLPAPESGAIAVSVWNGPVKSSVTIPVRPGASYTRGLVMTADGKAAGGASILFPDGKKITASETGEYVIGGIPFFGVETVVSKPGFFARRETFTRDLVQDPVILTPIARGVLMGRQVIIDLTRYADNSFRREEKRPDVQTALRLRDLLRASGAECILLDEAPPAPAERKKLFQSMARAVMIQIGVDEKKSIVSILSGDAEPSRQLAKSLLKSLPVYTGLLLRQSIPRFPQREDAARMRQVSVYIPEAGPRSYESRLVPLVSSNIAWGIYHALLLQEGYKLGGTKRVDVTVIRRDTKEPAAFAEVILNGALQAAADAKGACRFYGVTVPEDDVRTLDPEKYEITGVKTEVLQ